jgi:hypothetical protein
VISVVIEAPGGINLPMAHQNRLNDIRCHAKDLYAKEIYFTGFWKKSHTRSLNLCVSFPEQQVGQQTQMCLKDRGD